MEMPENCLEYPCDDVCGESCQVMDGIVEGKENMERLTYKTNGKYLNTTSEQAPPYAIDCDVDMAITKLAEYEDLEEQGKLLKLPCAVGDTVYAIEVDEENFTYFHCPRKISEYKFNLQMMALLGMFRKYIFLTREEAEAALKALQG